MLDSNRQQRTEKDGDREMSITCSILQKSTTDDDDDDDDDATAKQADRLYSL